MPFVRRSLPIVLGLATCSLPAHADGVTGSRSEQLYERRHEITATLHPGWASLVVRRTVENLGPRHDQALFWLELPTGAVATGLRTLGGSPSRPQWFSGELLEAEAAAAKYRELTGLGGYYPKDPALLSWRHQGLLALQVFPVPPGESKTVEYKLLLPTQYRDGAHRLELPGLGTRDLVASVTLGRAGTGQKLLLDRRPAAAGATARTALGKTAELGLVPRTNGPLDGELGVANAGNGRFVTHFSVEAAPRVATVPKRAFVVVVLDTSRSIPSAVVESEQATLAAYLSHLPDAEVEILTFARNTRRRYGRFVPAARAKADLVAMHPEQQNGSDVDAALAEAEHLLTKTPTGRPRRIVLLTDGNVRSSLRPERIRAALGPSGAIVHIGILPGGGESILERADGHPWAPAARSTGGLVWNATVSGTSEEKLRAAYEEWARPLRIDALRVFSPDIELGTSVEPLAPTLDEGEGASRLFLAARPVSWIRIEGELWSRKVEQVLHPDPKAGDRWAALVFGSELEGELSEQEMMKLAMRGGAVSPVTSYLAIEPGVRPSTEGLDWNGSVSAFGVGVPSVRMGYSSVSGRAPPIDREAWLKDALAPAYRACGGKPDAATVSLETTYAEVVDVTRVSLSDNKDPLLERCLRQAVWDLVLPAGFDLDFASFTVYL